MPDETPKTYDVFISHASEDKAEVARPLAQELERLGLAVWLDEFQLTLGDSLRQEIDRGLTQSRFGVVILSPNFFRKEWTARELDALVAIEGEGKAILPVWHHLTKEQIVRYSPLVAGKLAVSTDKGISYVAKEIVRAIKREEGDDFRIEPPEDNRAQKLVDIRRRLLVSSTSLELRRLKYEIDGFLSIYPNDVDGKILSDDVSLSLTVTDHLSKASKDGSFYSWALHSRVRFRTWLKYILMSPIVIGTTLFLLLLIVIIVIIQNWK